MIRIKSLIEKTSEWTIHLLFFGHDVNNCYSRGRRLTQEGREFKESEIRQLALFTGLTVQQVFDSAWEDPRWVMSRSKVNLTLVMGYEIGETYLRNRELALERFEKNQAKKKRLKEKEKNS